MTSIGRIMIDGVMNSREFKHGLLRLAEDGPELINERVVARLLAASYIDADISTQRDCTAMLIEDLAKLDAVQPGLDRDD